MMIPLSPALLIACASGRLSGTVVPGPAHHGAQPHVNGDRRRLRALIRRFDRTWSAPVRSWDDEGASIRFINTVGYWSHYDHRAGFSSWPLPHLDSVDALAALGRRRLVLFHEPRFGDLVVTWSGERNRFVRTAIVASVVAVRQDEVRCLTLGAHREGPQARLEHLRPRRGDRFVRWVDLERASLFGVPVEVVEKAA